MEKKRVEVLAPAGSYESLVAAVNAGADAVYIGGSRFGARAYADNPDEDLLIKALDYAHLHGSSVYMTVNTLVRDDELSDLEEYLTPYYEHGLDAVIVQDLGVFSYVRRHFPGLPIHASTQMTITGVYGAKVLADMGAARIVTARELSLEEISEIHSQVDVEIESFVHGALCYCYSGQCLFSSLIGGRSGNRGRCAQPCRLPYDVLKDGKKLNRENERYVLSLKDLCTLDLIPDLIEAGVYSMKIEGRMKSPRYTAGVVSIYRKYVDLYLEKGREGYRVKPEDKRMLLDLFDRGGQTDGYYEQHNGRDMMVLKEKPSFREGNQKLFDDLDTAYVNRQKQEPVKGSLILETGQPSVLKLECKTVEVQVTGKTVQAAQKQPLTEEKIVKQMKKTRNTPFFFEDLCVELKGSVFMPVQELNELRRLGLERLEGEILGRFLKNPSVCPKEQMRELEDGSALSSAPDPKLHVLLEKKELLEAVVNIEEVSEILIDSGAWDGHAWSRVVSECHQWGKTCFLAMPYIFRKEAESYFLRWKEELLGAGFDGILVRSLEETEFLKENGIELPLIFDYNLYAYNKEARSGMFRLGADRLTLPVELNSRELERLGCGGGELIVYGSIPMMVSAQCIRKTMKGCRKEQELLYLKDRMGKEMPVRNICPFCYNIFYNSTPLSLLGDHDLIKRLDPGGIRLQFSVEGPEEMKKIIKAFADVWIYGKSAVLPMKEYTRGHFKRGVE
ncbi:U32 family peptidase [Clostridium sp. MCC353]|uniref:U32 family peptidase n=1 Tax=Clostridium sp. MCC353 TaxID=2592646 RepID=UPI001C01FFD6|nr:U32 family peptidase [Clostridium sp. MCC353]MBT9779812.1 U32 family peptidase [Clostridium sp. MCC353]